MRKGLIILGDLLEQDLVWLASAGTIRDVEKGEILIEANRDIEHLFVVTDGSFSIRIGGANAPTAAAGDVLGEMSFVEKRLPSATVVANEAARVLAVPRTALLQEFQDNTGFAARFYHALAVFLSDRLRSASGSDSPDELDEILLDNLHVAGDHFLSLLELLDGSRAKRRPSADPVS